MHVQSCSFAYKTYCFLTFSSPSASLDLKVPNGNINDYNYQYFSSIIWQRFILSILLFICFLLQFRRLLDASKPRTHHAILFCCAGVRKEECGNALSMSRLTYSYNFSFLVFVTVVNFALSVAPSGNTVTNSRGRKARALSRSPTLTLPQCTLG